MLNGVVNDNFNYIAISGFPDDKVYKDMVNMYSEIFEDADLDFFKKRVEEHTKLLSVLAYLNNQLIGFKAGYPYNKEIFYSWIGGVLPKYRQQGSGTKMVQIQEDFARSNGFKKLRTKSMNIYKAMMILNLKNGFDITNVYTNTRGQTKIVFEKLL